MCDVSVVEDTDASVEQWSLGNIPVEVCVNLNLSQFSVKTILILSNLNIICFHLCTFNSTENLGYFYCCIMSIASGYKIIFIMRGYHVLCLCCMSVNLILLNVFTLKVLDGQCIVVFRKEGFNFFHANGHFL
jgi:hypothetical protein